MAHVFISYVRENETLIDKLCSELGRNEIKYWRDRENLRLGKRWQDEIRKAIQNGGFFIACFSAEYEEKDRSYMNEELTLAIEELRKRRTNTVWFLPIKLSECSIPDRSIGGGETLNDLQWVDMFSNWNTGMSKIVQAIDPSITISPKIVSKERHVLSPVAEDLSEQVLEFSFDRGTDLVTNKAEKILYKYRRDLINGNLEGFHFSRSKIDFQIDLTYEKLKQSIDPIPPFLQLKSKIKKLEDFLVEGTRIILNYAYLKDYQLEFTLESCRWFTRAIQSWIFWCIEQYIGRHETLNLQLGLTPLESPMLGKPKNIESFYGCELIKIDLWNQSKVNSPRTSIFLDKYGLAGSWFTRYPQMHEPFLNHYSPNDFYKFVLPQMVMKHLINGEEIIQDWSKYRIGCA